MLSAVSLFRFRFIPSVWDRLNTVRSRLKVVRVGFVFFANPEKKTVDRASQQGTADRSGPVHPVRFPDTSHLRDIKYGMKGE